MRNKKIISYDDIFTFLKNQYHKKFEAELTPHMFHLDCELATITSLKNNFPDSPITLCSVHILRNMMKHLKEHTVGNFYENKTLLKFWKTLSGSFFLNLSNPEILSSILTYFRQDIMDELEPNFRVGLSNFIEKYLVKYYFRSDALYNFTLFNYYENSSAGNYNFSTNSLESVNRRLKEACGAGQLPLKKSFVKLRDFKKGYIGKFKRKVKRNQLNPRKQKTIRRQEMLEGIYDVYKNLLPDEQITEAVSTAFLIGNLNQVEVQSSFYEESPENNTFFDDSSDDE